STYMGCYDATRNLPHLLPIFALTFTTFSFNAPPPPEIYTLSLHDALPIFWPRLAVASMMELSHDLSHSVADLQARLQSVLGDAYHIERELGGGGMSRLFLATEASLHRQGAVELLPPQFA